MGTRKTWIEPFERTYPSGKKSMVGESTGGFNRKIPYKEQQLAQFKPISQEFAENFNKKRLLKTHPDSISTARITFIKPNKMWQENPQRYDVVGLDAPDIPEYLRIPHGFGIPGQIIQVQGDYFVCGNDGLFHEVYPPNDKRFGKFKDSKISLLSKQQKSRMSDIEQLETEIEQYSKLRRDPNNTEKRNKELDGMIRARKHGLEIIMRKSTLKEKRIELDKISEEETKIRTEIKSFQKQLRTARRGTKKEAEIIKKIDELKETKELIITRRDHLTFDLLFEKETKKKQRSEEKLEDSWKKFYKESDVTDVEEDLIKELGDIEMGIIDHNRITMLTTPEIFKGTQMEIVSKEKKISLNKLPDQFLLGKYGDKFMVADETGTLYDYEKIEKAFKNLDKNTRNIYYSGAESSPIIVHDKDFVFAIAPRRQEFDPDFTGDVSIISENDIILTNQEWKKFNKITKDKWIERGKFEKDEIKAQKKKLKPELISSILYAERLEELKSKS